MREHPAVIWPGHIHYQSMPSVFNLCDVLILPSIPTVNWEEQFGMCLVEAMSCGKPTVATNVGGIPYVVEDRVTSLLIPYKSSQAIEDAIVRLYQRPDDAKEIGAQARKLVCQSYAKKATGRRL